VDLEAAFNRAMDHAMAQGVINIREFEEIKKRVPDGHFDTLPAHSQKLYGIPSSIYSTSNLCEGNCTIELPGIYHSVVLACTCDRAKKD
jgi:hypothetical protein